MTGKTQRYVDEEVQESLFEAQMDAEASEARFKGFGTVDEETVSVRLKLPTGRVREVDIGLPSAADWEGSTAHRLLVHLGIHRREDVESVVDSSVPITSGDGRLKVDAERLDADERESPSSPTLAIGESVGVMMLGVVGIITGSAFVAIGHVGIGIVLALVLFFVPFMAFTPWTVDGLSRD